MDLEAKLKSQLDNIEVIVHSSQSYEIIFSSSGASVNITQDSDSGRYSASYPELVRDGNGGRKVDDGFSEGMLEEGLFWILWQVRSHGKVKPEVVD